MKLVSIISEKPDYWCALQTLAWSLSHNGKVTGLDWILIWDGNPRPGYEDAMRAYGFNPITMNVKDFDADFSKFGKTNKHLVSAKYKLLFWLLDPKDLYIGIDIDMVCRKDARELLTFKHFSVECRPGAPGFCSGLMVFRPDKDAFYHMVNDIAPRVSCRLADQAVLNAYYIQEHPEEVNLLPWKWNTSKREVRQPNWKQLLDEAIFLHMTGAHKPWLVREMGYEDAFRIWHEAYAKAQEAL